MADKELYFSQMAGMDRSTMGTAMETDENGATVHRSTREKNQWVLLQLLQIQLNENEFVVVSQWGTVASIPSITGLLNW